MNNKKKSFISVFLNKIDPLVFDILSVFLFTAVPIVVLGSLILGARYLIDAADTAKKGGWTTQEIKGEIYTLDSCTGNIKKITLP